MKNQLLSDSEINELVTKYPLYSQDGKGGNAIALYRFYLGGASWYVLEGSEEIINGKKNISLFGLVNMYDIELGYFSLNEMEELETNLKIVNEDGNLLYTIPAKIERDRSFKPTQLKDLQGEAEREYIKKMKW
ncbi:MAG: DUF2958 domain-containing protein [Bacteroidaceae bacterium]|nr:DUF2958 domain-containing protein [Bacteroidaceae bacterium]